MTEVRGVSGPTRKHAGGVSDSHEHARLSDRHGEEWKVFWSDDSIRMVRLLLNDVDTDNEVFSDSDISDFLTLERGRIKRAAAQAIDTNASNEALASKVLRSQDWSTDGAKVADALRAHADRLRKQDDDDNKIDEEADDLGWFGFVENDPTGHGPEHTNPPGGHLHHLGHSHL